MDAEGYRGDYSVGDEVLPRLKWLLFLRVVAITLLLGATAVLHIRAGSSYFTISLVRIYVIIGLTYAFTAISGGVLRWVKNIRPFAYLQVCYDILLITALIAVTGRVFSFLYIVGILSAGIILYRAGALTAAVLGAGCYMVLLIGVNRYGENIRYFNEDFVADVSNLSAPELMYNLGINTVAFFLVALLSNYLTEKLRRTGMQLAEREEDLEVLEAWSENVIRSLPSGLITTDSEGIVNSFNRAAELITGIKAEEVINRPVSELFAPVTSEGSPPEIIYTDKEGNRRYLGMSLSVLESSKGRDIGRILIFQDQTVYREMEEQLKISDRLAAVGQLAAGLAHEIRNPLASISGSIQLLRRDNRFEEDDRLLKILLRETESLNELITEFLHFARPSPGQVKRVNMKELLEETLELFHNRSEGGEGVNAELDCPPDIEVMLDTNLMHQVLWNLLVNASEAMEGSGGISIEVREVIPEAHSEEGKGVRLIVVDEGPGIPEDIKEKVFAPFFTTKEYGTGLGLATVHRSVEYMGGTIRLRSEEEKGTAFIIDLPAKMEKSRQTSKEAAV